MQVNRADYLNGRTALHFAAVSGHARCIRLIVADYVPSVPNLWNTLQSVSTDESASMKTYPDQRLFIKIHISTSNLSANGFYFLFQGVFWSGFRTSVARECC